MWWGWFVCRCLSLAALLVVADCGGAEQRRGAEEGLRSSTAKANSSSGRKYHRIQQGQCSYTFILPEGDGGACRDFKAGTPYNANTPQQDAPQPEADSSNQKIQQLEHVMENYTQWLQKVSSIELCKGWSCNYRNFWVHNYVVVEVRVSWEERMNSCSSVECREER